MKQLSYNIVFPWRNSPQWARPSSFEDSRSHSDTPQSVELWTSDQPDPENYLTTRNTNKTQTSMPTAGFEPTFPASEKLQTHTLDRAVTGIGYNIIGY